MVVATLLQQYNVVGEKHTVILYTYINCHAGTPDKKQEQARNNVVQPIQYSTIAVIVYDNIKCHRTMPQPVAPVAQR